MRWRVLAVVSVGLSLLTLACVVPAWAFECPVLSALMLPMMVGTPTPYPIPYCDSEPTGVFGTIYSSDPTVAARLGCPVQFEEFQTEGPIEVQTSFETFERGRMLWVSMYALPGENVRQTIFVIHPDGSYDVFDDTFDPSTDPFSGGETSPSGLFEPVLGFGKLWRENAEVREALGWATAPEVGSPGLVRPFERGVMIYSQAAGGTYIFFYGDAGWDFRPITY